MFEIVTEQKNEIRSVLLWQLLVLIVVSVLAWFVLSAKAGVMLGGIFVMISTWHVHKSVYLSGGDRMSLLKAAGVRFGMILLLLGAAVVVFKLPPLHLVLGMFAAYVAMYARSLFMIFKKLKGDGVV